MILGIDEVGRGPWAGPLVVGAVILGDAFPADVNLTDSKKLTPKKREILEPLILESALAHGLGWVSAKELDEYGLSASLKLSTRRAVKEVLRQLSKKPKNTLDPSINTDNPPEFSTSPENPLKITQIIIDGTINFLKGTPLEDLVETLPKADLLVREVSAASIIAKVARDRYMAEIALQYPAYGFEKHVGYGTALHRKALLEHGICPEHRQSFRPIREIFAQNPPKSPNSAPNTQNTPLTAPENARKEKAPSTSQKGQTAELAVASYLKTQNHTIIAHNFKTKSYEIDLISIQKPSEALETPASHPENLETPKIFFTEVKYSRNRNTEGTPLVRITAKKQAKIHFAAECFLESHPEYQAHAPILAAASVSGSDYQVDDWFILV